MRGFWVSTEFKIKGELTGRIKGQQLTIIYINNSSWQWITWSITLKEKYNKSSKCQIITHKIRMLKRHYGILNVGLIFTYLVCKWFLLSKSLDRLSWEPRHDCNSDLSGQLWQIRVLVFITEGLLNVWQHYRNDSHWERPFCLIMELFL